MDPILASASAADADVAIADGEAADEESDEEANTEADCGSYVVWTEMRCGGKRDAKGQEVIVRRIE